MARDYKRILDELNNIEDILSDYVTLLGKISEGELPPDNFSELERKAREAIDRFFEDESLKPDKNAPFEEIVENLDIYEKRRNISSLIKEVLIYSEELVSYNEEG